MKLAFIDSSAFFALLTREDPFHTRAAEAFVRANSENWQLFTTNAVVIEAYALILNRTREGRAKAIAFLDELQRTQMRIERCTEEDEANALALVRAHVDKNYSLCDALSFTVMERLGAVDAITSDDDFRSYGRFVVH